MNSYKFDVKRFFGNMKRYKNTIKFPEPEDLRLMQFNKNVKRQKEINERIIKSCNKQCILNKLTSKIRIGLKELQDESYIQTLSKYEYIAEESNWKEFTLYEIKNKFINLKQEESPDNLYFTEFKSTDEPRFVDSVECLDLKMNTLNRYVNSNLEKYQKESKDIRWLNLFAKRVKSVDELIVVKTYI